MKTFILTGCASGIGKHLTGELAARGHRVVATDINFEALEAAARAWPTANVTIARLDVREPDAWAALVSDTAGRFGSVDVVMNVAGYLKPGWVHEMSADEARRHYDINVLGVALGSQASARQMVKQGHGHIVNIASMAALAPIPGLAFYSSSKYAVRGFSLALAQELRPRGVAVTVVCPDAVQTPMLDLQKSYEQASMTFSAPRLLTVSDVTDVILNRVLEKRPLEVFIPGTRGYLARFADLFPGISFFLGPILRRRGRSRQLNYGAKQ